MIVLDGDGALLMRLGALATVGHERPPNLVHVLLDNQRHESTGGQATVSHSVDFPSLAAACGYARAARVGSLDELARALGRATPGPVFLHVRIAPGVPDDLPRPSVRPDEVAARLRAHLESPALTHRNPLLLNPGPVTMSERVHHALSESDVCHREDEFAALTLDVKRRLEGLYPGLQGYEAVLLTGSGTAAVEAMLDSLVPREGKVLVVANGVYGERMAAILHAHGKALVPLRGEWTARHRPGRGRACARRRPRHHPRRGRPQRDDHRPPQRPRTAWGASAASSTGRCWSTRSRASAARPSTSQGWNAAALASTSNKCLHGAPGICFVLARRALLDDPSHAGTLYLDLARYRHEQRQGWSPFTQATHVMRALQEALCELEQQGGWEARRERYRAIATRVRAGLRELGVEPLLDPQVYSSMISSFRLPRGTTYAALHDALREEGFVIYAGQGELARSIFRVANMGDLRDSDVDRLLGACGHVLRA